jgi:enoyl-[acyl-carrier protein] reductase I
LAESLGSEIILPCDVQDEAQLETVFAELEKRWGKIDFVVHAVAFANREDLKNPFSQTSRAGFQLALDISAYSLISMTRAAMPIMNEGGSIITMTYLGAMRAIPGYNIMGVAKAALEASVRYLAAEVGEQGVRVNAISAGPIKTLAASGVGNFNEKLRVMEKRSPLKRTVSQEEVGKASLYLLSDLASGVTGEVHYVDGGFSIAEG